MSVATVDIGQPPTAPYAPRCFVSYRRSDSPSAARQIADALTRSGIWFVFTTGYDTEEVSEPYQDHPRCIKPFQAPALIAILTPSSEL